ncbi:MAG: ribose ABC transporter permease [Chloroflexota bacterium]|nr:ribose ABC transporter permease [Chloroflexota bacterium]
MSVAAPTGRMRSPARWIRWAAEYGIYVAFGLLLVGLAVVSPVFATPSNLFNIALQSSINALLAFGMTFVILTAGIDLSVGSLLALSGGLAGGLMVGGGLPWPLAALVGLAAGTALGAINGVAITAFRIPPFIATLAMLSIGRGLTQLYTGGRPFTGLDPAFNQLGQGEIGPVPIPVMLMIVVVAAGWVVLRFTVFGRHVYAVGSNREAARLAGVPVAAVLVAVYAISGLLAALGGLVITARLSSAQPTAGAGFELDAIAAVVVGGMSLSGGEGSILRSLIGALIIGVLNNGLNLLNVDPFVQPVVKGLVILVAVGLDRLKTR